MTSISFGKILRNEFYKNVSARNRVQDKNPKQQKLKAKVTYKNDEKILTNFEPFNPENVIIKKF